MMKVSAIVLCAAVAQVAGLRTDYPVMGAGKTKDTCDGVTCQSLECIPPFQYQSPEDNGTCCPLCWSPIKVPEDRSWAKGLSGGIGMNNNADPILCRDVVCPPLDCPEFDQGFDDRCCTKCKSSLNTVTAADRKAALKEEYGPKAAEPEEEEPAAEEAAVGEEAVKEP